MAFVAGTKYAAYCIEQEAPRSSGTALVLGTDNVPLDQYFRTTILPQLWTAYSNYIIPAAVSLHPDVEQVNVEWARLVWDRLRLPSDQGPAMSSSTTTSQGAARPDVVASAGKVLDSNHTKIVSEFREARKRQYQAPPEELRDHMTVYMSESIHHTALRQDQQHPPLGVPIIKNLMFCPYPLEDPMSLLEQ